MADELFDRSEFVSYFRDETGELLDRMDSDLLVLEENIDGGKIDAELINAIFRSLHTIKGSAGMLDFTGIQRVAHRLENAIDLLRSNTIILDEHFLTQIFTGRDLLGTLIDRAVAGDLSPIPEIEEFIAELEMFVAAKTASADSQTVKIADEKAIVVLDEVAAFEAEVERLLAEQASIRNEAGQPDFAAAEKQAHAETAVDAPTLPDTIIAPERGSAVDTLVSAIIAPLPVPEPAAARAPGTPPPPMPKVPMNSTIRVDLERLDTLLDLVGELVINRTQIAGIAHSLQRAIERDAKEAIPLAKDLAASASTLARITNELQESVMKARMVPVGQVFERFPRTVRDLAKSTGKNMTLALSGVDTDLDKTIVDQIGEPLMHLVRNCADHGIEPPEVRAEHKKPPVATIRLNAYHEGNQVIIEIGDDGGGIDLQKIRARGVERGLIDANGNYSDSDILDLIFAPGFSTAQVVSAISGRGVGMDVVKRCVNDLKGTLEVDTKLGIGTTFTIRLPLTLAIIRTLLVRVLDRLYAIPLDVVIESQRILSSEVRTIRGSPVVTLRGQVVPLVLIGERFGLPEKTSSDGYEMIVIVAHKGRRVGLVVDGFEGEQEIVIKPLSEIIGDTGCIAGATILGNGAIALILDIAALTTSISRYEHLSLPAEAQLL